MSNHIIFSNTAKQLQWYIHFNSLDDVKTIIKNPTFKIDTILPNGLTALHFAIQLNNKNLIYYLLSNGANVNSLNAEGDTALNYFLHYSNDSDEESLGILLNLIIPNAVVNHIDSFSMEPLETAFRLKQLKFLEILLQSNAANDHVPRHTIFNVILHLAIANKDMDILYILLNNYINLEIPNHEGRTVLQVAMIEHQLSTIRLLLDYNVKFDYHHYFVANYCRNLCDNYSTTFLAHFFYHLVKRVLSKVIDNNTIAEYKVFQKYQLELNFMHTKKFMNKRTYYEVLMDDYKRSAFENFPTFLYKLYEEKYISNTFPLFGDILKEKLELVQRRKIHSDAAFIKLNDIIVKNIKLISLTKNIIGLIIISLTDKELSEFIEANKNN